MLPAVSFLKAPAYQDGHAAYSDPIDEQHFLVNEINAIQKSPEWKSTAVVIAYDDSDGWYDHVAAPDQERLAPTRRSTPAICDGSTAPVAGGYQDRCGPGPRLPLLVISPYARRTTSTTTQTEQTSILKFIEDNWFTGRIGDASFDAARGQLGRHVRLHRFEQQAGPAEPERRGQIDHADQEEVAARGRAPGDSFPRGLSRGCLG